MYSSTYAQQLFTHFCYPIPIHLVMLHVHLQDLFSRKEPLGCHKQRQGTQYRNITVSMENCSFEMGFLLKSTLSM